MIQTKPFSSYKKQTHETSFTWKKPEPFSIKTTNDAFINYRDNIQTEFR